MTVGLGEGAEVRHTGSPSAGSPPPAVYADRLQVVTHHMDQLILKEKMRANTKVEFKHFLTYNFFCKSQTVLLGLRTQRSLWQ